MAESSGKRLILVTGATGYVGGRLIRPLEARGERVRCMARRPEVLKDRVGPDTEVVFGDLATPETLPPAFEDVHTAYYLVHSLGAIGDFEKRELQNADHFAQAAKRAGVRRIIYLGGLCDESAQLSSHLRSRLKVGEILRASGIQTVEFRASIIIGSGSLSFELIRTLVRRLPVMVTPRWVRTMAQPIAITDVLSYLEAGLDLERTDQVVYEIGGREQMSYAGLVKEYARIRGLRRLIIPVPVLTPHFSSHWLNLVTPVYSRIGRRLIDSLTTPTVVTCTAALREFNVQPMGVREAIEQARRNEDQENVETHWADALSSVGGRKHWGGVVFGNRLVDLRTVHIDVPPAFAFAPIRRVGGRNGWPYANVLWRLRGLIDRLIGGVGMYRGRRDPDWLRVGDALDCWRVEAFYPPWKLVLVAEMRMPGRAWLQFEIAREDGGVRISQTAIFDPVGVGGVLYWYTLWPFHEFVFSGMLRNLARQAVDGYESQKGGDAHPETA